MTCTHTRGDLTCTRTTDHDPDARGGHVYEASWSPDQHDRTDEAVEAGR